MSEDQTADKAHWVFIEHDGALFRGPSRGYPMEVWRFKTKNWAPYSRDVPKGVEWGTIVSEEEFEQLKSELA